MRPWLSTWGLRWRTNFVQGTAYNPSAVSGRQGHTVQVMLNNYSSQRISADQAVADHLGVQGFGDDEPIDTTTTTRSVGRLEPGLDLTPVGPAGLMRLEIALDRVEVMHGTPLVRLC